MPEFCDVAVPVPLDGVFSYRIADGQIPVVGGRVLVPFRSQRLSGIATELRQMDFRLLPRADWGSISDHAAPGGRVQEDDRLSHH
jgi:primosomal protein N'